MVKECDTTSVGVIVRDSEGRFALLKRACFPIGIAPAAGHIDEHGSPEQAAREEVHEELGIMLGDLRKTTIYERRVENACRRPGGDHHTWYIYEATAADSTLKPDTEETKGANWYDGEQLHKLAARTRRSTRAKFRKKTGRQTRGLRKFGCRSWKNWATYH
ncbi:MAG TPA: NUDIX hydrolase [Candidatus Saccharimonadales bacterium]|jgi:8-oxo-dGTP pyrophosphatase MutT (NUDIX family)